MSNMTEKEIKEKIKEAEWQGQHDFLLRLEALKGEFADERGWREDNEYWYENDDHLYAAECYAYEILEKEFFLGDKVKIRYISDCNPHNDKVGVIVWLKEYEFYPHGDDTESETRVQGTILYDDGTTESVGDFYRKGSGIVSPVTKVR